MKGGFSACAAGKRCTVAAPAIFAAVVLGAVAVGPATASASQAVLTWEAPTTTADGSPLTDLAGYRIYLGTAPGEYQQVIDAGPKQIYLVDNLSGGTYYFAVTAYNTSGDESDYSEEVIRIFAAGATAPPPFPTASATFTVADALSALKYTVGAAPLTTSQLTQYDLAPLDAEGTSHPDGAVDIADVVAILRTAVGLK